MVEWEVAEPNFSHRNVKFMTTYSENSLELHEGQQKIFSTSNDTKKKPEKDGQEEQRYDKSKLTPLGRRPIKRRIITIAVVLTKEQGVQAPHWDPPHWDPVSGRGSPRKSDFERWQGLHTRKLMTVHNIGSAF